MTLCDILLWTDLCLLHKHLLRDVLGNMFFQQQVIKNFSKTLKIYLWRNPFLGCRTTIYNFTKKTGGLINKKSIKLCKFDRVPNIMSKVIGGCFLYWIKIADNMNEKTAVIWIKTPPRQFSILVNDLAETLKRTVLTEQTH